MTPTRIPLSNGLVLKADANGWIIAEQRVWGPEAKNAGQEYDFDLKYPGSSLYMALMALQDMTLRRSGAEDFEGLMETIRSFRKEVSDLLAPRLEVKL